MKKAKRPQSASAKMALFRLQTANIGKKFSPNFIRARANSARAFSHLYMPILTAMACVTFGCNDPGNQRLQKYLIPVNDTTRTITVRQNGHRDTATTISLRGYTLKHDSILPADLIDTTHAKRQDRQADNDWIF